MYGSLSLRPTLRSQSNKGGGGSLYCCRWAGKGVQPLSIPSPPHSPHTQKRRSTVKGAVIKAGSRCKIFLQREDKREYLYEIAFRFSLIKIGAKARSYCFVRQFQIQKESYIDIAMCIHRYCFFTASLLLLLPWPLLMCLDR